MSAGDVVNATAAGLSAVNATSEGALVTAASSPPLPFPEQYAALGAMVVIALCVVYAGSRRALHLHVNRGSESDDEPEGIDVQMAAEFPFQAGRVLFLLYVLLKYVPLSLFTPLMACYFTIFSVVSLNYAVRPVVGANVIVGLSCIGAGYVYTQYKPWLVNNVFAISMGIVGIENVRLSSFAAASLLLTGLFFYDIFFVFGTDIMLTVATTVEGPIKVVFPNQPVSRGVFGDVPASLLGLGDIVIPGFYIAFVLIYGHKNDVKEEDANGDAAKAKEEANKDGKTEKKNASKKKKDEKGSDVAVTASHEGTPARGNAYFYEALVAYVLSLVTTMYVMVVYQHGQPALLYIVPYLLITTLVGALLRGDLMDLIYYSTEKADTDDASDARTTDSSSTEEEEKEGDHKKDDKEEKKDKKKSNGKDAAASGNKDDEIAVTTFVIELVKDFFGLGEGDDEKKKSEKEVQKKGPKGEPQEQKSDSVPKEKSKKKKNKAQPE